MNLTRTSCPHGTRRRPDTTFRERKLANVVGKLAQMMRLERKGLQHTREYHILCRKVRNAISLPAGTVEDQYRFVSDQLRQLRNHMEHSRINQWKQRLRDSLRSVTVG